MMRCAFLLAVAACAPQDKPLLIDGANETAMAGTQVPIAIETVRAAARAEANRLHARQCGTVEIADDVFAPVEVTGGGTPEYAMTFGRALCTSQRAYSVFSGTGGSTVQIWSAGGDVPRLLFEHMMFGLTPTSEGFLSFQHGSACPGGSGPGVCLVTYAWSPTGDGFQVRSRTLYDDRNPGRLPRIAYDWNHPLPG